MVLFTSLSRVQGNHMGFLVRENDWSEIYSGIHCSACRHRYIVNVNYNWRTIRELQWLMNHEFHKPWWQVNIPDYRKVFLRYYHTLWRYWFTDLLIDMASRIIITFHPLTLFTRSNSFFNKADFQITLPETTVFPVSVHGGGKEKI